jgi:hypothetical protein
MSWKRLKSGLLCSIHDASETDTFPPTVGLIDDTDTPVAANFNVAPGSLADRTRWLKNRTGSYRPTAIIEGNVGSSGPFAAFGSGTQVFNSGGAGWYDVTLLSLNLLNSSFTILTGDIIECEFHSTDYQLGTPSDPTYYAFGLAASLNSGANVLIPGGSQTIATNGGWASGNVYPMDVYGTFTVGAPDTGKALTIGLQAYYDGTHHTSLTLLGGYAWAIRQWRINP